MSNYNSKKTYETLTEQLGGKLPTGYNPYSFPARAHGQTVMGFRPYREKMLPNGKHDVRTEGDNGFVKVALAGYGEVWASLEHGGNFVTLLGWGNCNAWLEDFAETEQAKLIEHCESR